MANSVTVNDIFSNTKRQSDSMVQQAEAFLHTLQSTAYNVATPTWAAFQAYSGMENVDPAVADSIVTMASLNPEYWSPFTFKGERPLDLEPNHITIPEFGAIPEMVLAEPVLNIPDAPNANLS